MQRNWWYKVCRWWRFNAEVVLYWLIILFAAVIAIVYGGRYLAVQRQCLAHGWADCQVTWDLRGYCVREENEYEITKPVSEAMEASDGH